MLCNLVYLGYFQKLWQLMNVRHNTKVINLFVFKIFSIKLNSVKLLHVIELTLNVTRLSVFFSTSI